MLEPTYVDFILFPSRPCTKCGAVLPRNSDFFGRDRTKPDGLTYACRKCRAERVALDVAAQRTRRRERREAVRV